MVSDSCLTESTWAMWFSGTRSTRDWPPGSELCLLLCSWQLLEEVPCNTQPAFVSWGWDVSALPDTLQGCTHVTHVQRALLCCSARAAGAGGSQALGTGSWQEQSPEELLLGRKSSHPLAVPVSGWIVLVWLPGLGRRCAQLSVQVQRGPWAGKQRELCPHCRSQGSVWDGKLGHVALKPHNAPAKPGPGWGYCRTPPGCTPSSAAMQVCEPDCHFVTEPHLPESSTTFNHLVN